MKDSILKISFVTILLTSLSACGGGGGGGGGGGTVQEYNGEWKGACETLATRSYKQNWTISNGTALTNDMNVWTAATLCDSGNPEPVKVTGSIAYGNKVDVAHTCVGGKADEVDITYLTVTARGLTFRGETTIKNLLATQGINALPKYGLLCKGTDGKIYNGDTSGANDGSTAAKRPTEMDATTPLVP